MIKGKTILVTGGTGSFGKALIKVLLDKYNPRAIRIYSRDELKQWEMSQKLQNHPKNHLLRFFIGDVRDKERLIRAAYGCDIIIHAAALKQVPACEYNPIEAIKTNINGAINVVDAALDIDAEKVVALSTDKASQPINLYGATKLCSDKLFIQANNYRGAGKTKFSVVRYGNVMGSRGSVVPLFLEQAKTGTINITHPDMTRFWITLDEAVMFVLNSLKVMQGGELFIPKIPSIKIVDLAQAIAPEAKTKIIGIRPGEKMHESLIGKDESINTYDLGDRYMIEPILMEMWDKNYRKYRNKKRVKKDFEYNSFNNSWYLTVSQTRKLLIKNKFI